MLLLKAVGKLKIASCFYIAVYTETEQQASTHTCASLRLANPVLTTVFENKNLCETPTPRVSTLCQDLFLCLPRGQQWLLAQMEDLKLDCLTETDISLPDRVKMFIPQLKFNFFFFNFQRNNKIEYISGQIALEPFAGAGEQGVSKERVEED